MKLRFWGAARQVTGSCFHLEVNGMQILVDCRMQQGEHADDANRAPLQFNPTEIDYLFLTHALSGGAEAVDEEPLKKLGTSLLIIPISP